MLLVKFDMSITHIMTVYVTYNHRLSLSESKILSDPISNQPIRQLGMYVLFVDWNKYMLHSALELEFQFQFNFH